MKLWRIARKNIFLFLSWIALLFASDTTVGSRRHNRRMGLDQSKTSRQSNTKIVEFPTYNRPAHSTGPYRPDPAQKTAIRTVRPQPPPRTSSFASAEKDDLIRQNYGIEGRRQQEDKFRPSQKEKSIRSCLSWEKHATSAPTAKEPVSGQLYPKGTCDKCDGCHLTDDCPIYKKKRDDHPG